MGKGEVRIYFYLPRVKRRLVNDKIYRTPAAVYKLKCVFSKECLYVVIFTASKMIESIIQAAFAARFRCSLCQIT